MFFKQIFRNARRNRKNNGLFFGSLIAAVVAFYTLLSMGEQDVMRFLKTLEGDAVQKLMLLVPSIYVLSLFFVFFLVYFACDYQLEGRRKELGMYLMLGMKRSRMFAMLMGETLFNSLVSLVIGLPVSLILTECVSLATAQGAGMGILGHKISFSWSAVLWTCAGFLAVQLLAMFILSVRFVRQEPANLLGPDVSRTQKVPKTNKMGVIIAIAGAVMLAAAYVLGVRYMGSFSYFVLIPVFVLGIWGTFWIFKGMGALMGRQIMKNSMSRTGLYTFTGRQIQENVLHQHKALAIASLLLLMAIACVSYGIGITLTQGGQSVRSCDFSIMDTDTDVSQNLTSGENAWMVKACYPMYLDHADMDLHEFNTDGLTEAIANGPQSSLRENMAENFSQRMIDYIIAESSYNQLLVAQGKEPIKLSEDQAALYTSQSGVEFQEILSDALKSNVWIMIDGKKYDLLPDLYTDNVVADRKITLYNAYILPDSVYSQLAMDPQDIFCYNVVLSDALIEDVGLMQGIMDMSQVLDSQGLHYENYLAGIGRNLFYTVAGSYITIYLGILFLIIANTVIGLKYLIWQRKNQRRYLTLLMLGSYKKDLCRSSDRQMYTFFGLALSVAVISGIFAIWCLFANFTRLPAATPMNRVILTAGAAFVVFVAVEWLYMGLIRRAGNRNIQSLDINNDRR
ncbi:MAG TPA: ABC transporter permease [Candidatus Scybalocola faecavium]|nr:ABC transporter permease [Candidatus Scybalocola faecavium]